MENVVALSLFLEALMGWLAELVVDVLARLALQVILGLFGYDLNWDAQDGRQPKGWPLVLSALLCFAVCAVVLGGLIWLVWYFSR
jgi:hypothetical protein